MIRLERQTSLEARRTFLDQYENLLMSEGDYFKLTKLIEPYKGILHRKADKLLFIFDSEKGCWKKRTK